MNINDIHAAFTDVTDDAIQSYLGFAKSGFIDQPQNVTTDSLVIYNLLNQDVDTDQFAETDYDYFGLVDYDELKDLIKIEFDAVRVYEINNDLISHMDTYYRQFGLDYINNFNWSTSVAKVNAKSFSDKTRYVALKKTDNINEFKQEINRNVFGGFRNDTNAVDQFIANN